MSYESVHGRFAFNEMSADESERDARLEAIRRKQMEKTELKVVRGGAEWIFRLEAPSSGDELTWLYIRAGSMSGGVFLAPDETRKLADMLNAAVGPTP